MKEEKQLSSVEWLIEQINPYGLSVHQDLFEQAKEMESKQRQEDTNYGYSQGWDDGNQNKEPMRPGVRPLLSNLDLNTKN